MTKRLGDIRLSRIVISSEREIFVIRSQMVDVWKWNGKLAIKNLSGIAPYIRGEAATFILHSRRAFIYRQRVARPED